LISRGIKADKISVVLNLADERIFHQPESPRQHPSDSKFRMIYHGTITRRYGVEAAIRAVALLKEKMPGIHLSLVGGGEYRDEAEKLVNELGVQANVTFMRTVVASELPTLLSNADIGVTAYRIDGFTEGCLPTKLLEYTAMGIPTVAARTPIIADYFTEETIEYCQPGSVEDFAEHIYRLYRDPNRYHEIAKNTFQFNRKYNWKGQADEYARLIDSLQN
jgi:glycosyltransferase involved in cell wall biosynthesis